MTAPFEQIPFDELPDHPRVPHAFLDVPQKRVRFDAPSWGSTEAAYRELGSGPPLLLVHGLMTTSYSFRYVLPTFAERFRTIAVDLVGSGDSDKPDAGYGPCRMADWIGAFQRALGIRGSAVVGNSMGGYLCMRLALRDPKAMSRLVNIHSPGLPTPRMTALAAATRLPGAESLLRWLVQRGPERWAHRNVHYYDETLKSKEEASIYGRPLATREGIHGFFGHLRESLDVGEMRAFERTLEERKERGAPFPVPLLLVYARRDPMVPPAVGARLRALLPGASHLEIDEGSHFCHVDAPDLVMPPMLRFLGDTGPRETA